jgi:hypothetical protein
VCVCVCVCVSVSVSVCLWKGGEGETKGDDFLNVLRVSIGHCLDRDASHA